MGVVVIVMVVDNCKHSDILSDVRIHREIPS